MRDLGLDPDALKKLFSNAQQSPYVVINVSAEFVAQLGPDLGTAFRRCYITDDAVSRRVAETKATQRDVIAVKIPDRGSVMAGDFGEILTSLVQAAEEHPTELLDPRKWRLKNDRTKAAPRSDVVQFVLPRWPDASSEDRLICSEVKTKSTASSNSPILQAIADSQKDSDGRLVKTLVWLRERALDTGLESVSIDQLNRFIEAIDHPPAEREFRAVAVVCDGLIKAELEGFELPDTEDRAVVIVVVPDLKQNYEAVYDLVVESLVEETDSE
ncbi:Hachiman antiphage defense system protein HamA [Mycobacterium avium]|uniref:Hachiman antiphage defense system protein HamA n=1 Tax=Mycobacterium avium TaxID=1764 RepID=UPI000D670703|nr:Hachiman antiphage defense system protein HamA [Mycobacterium avium]